MGLIQLKKRIIVFVHFFPFSEHLQKKEIKYYLFLVKLFVNIDHKVV